MDWLFIMQVLIKYLGGLSLAAKVEEEFVQTKEKSLMQFLMNLIYSKNQEFRQELLHSNTNVLKEYITIVLNGRIIPHDDLLSTEITDGDEIALLLPILGG